MAASQDFPGVVFSTAARCMRGRKLAEIMRGQGKSGEVFMKGFEQGSVGGGELESIVWKNEQAIDRARSELTILEARLLLHQAPICETGSSKSHPASPKPACDQSH
jgi:hypothetical protein